VRLRSVRNILNTRSAARLRVQGALGRDATPRPRRSIRGQALVEFGLVFPIFLFLIMAIIEFAFVFNAVLSVNFAARGAALTAAEAGNAAGADCIILTGIERDVGAPADHARITQVQIYRTTLNGIAYPGSTATIYTRGTGTVTCTYPDRPQIVVPYKKDADGYTEANRCNFLKGCPVDSVGLSHSSVDHVGVRILYNHLYKTPVQTLFSGNSLSFDRSNSMRMEPVL
jgi:hypothetical protein